MSAPDAPSLPAPVAEVAAALARLPGVEAVVLGGSRATGAARPDSDWDLGIYYRGAFDPEPLRALPWEGYVSAVGEWGAVVNGGAWLTAGGLAVDVLYRDLDTVERWLAEAEAGRFELLPQNGTLLGAPSYTLVGELAVCVPLHGSVPRAEFPPALAEQAALWWRGRASVSLMFAGGYAEAGNATCCLGMLADAALAAAHGRLAERGEWALNEKLLLARTGLDGVDALLLDAGAGRELTATVAAVADALGVAPLAAR